MEVAATTLAEAGVPIRWMHPGATKQHDTTLPVFTACELTRPLLHIVQVPAQLLATSPRSKEKQAFTYRTCWGAAICKSYSMGPATGGDRSASAIGTGPGCCSPGAPLQTAVRPSFLRFPISGNSHTGSVAYALTMPAHVATGLGDSSRPGPSLHPDRPFGGPQPAAHAGSHAPSQVRSTPLCRQQRLRSWRLGPRGAGPGDSCARR